MDQEELRQLGDKEAIKNELVKEFTRHLEEPDLPDDTVVKVKMVVLGPMRAGKTSWVTRVTNDKFNTSEPPTIGAKFSSQGVAIDETEYQFEIWDVSGEEWCRALCPMYLQHAHAAVICYDPSEEESFLEAKEWVEYAKKQGDRDLIIALVGTKHDLISVGELPVKTEEVEAFFIESQELERDFLFPDVSNKSGENVQDVILTIAEAFHERGVKAPRGSVLRDGDKAFGDLVDKGIENKEIMTKTEAQENEKVEKCKSKLETFTESVKKGATACFDSSKRTANKTYQSTRVKSTQFASGTKKFTNSMSEKSRRVLRRNDEPSAKMVEVNTVPAKTNNDLVRNSEQMPNQEFDA